MRRAQHGPMHDAARAWMPRAGRRVPREARSSPVGIIQLMNSLSNLIGAHILQFLGLNPPIITPMMELELAQSAAIMSLLAAGICLLRCGSAFELKWLHQTASRLLSLLHRSTGAAQSQKAPVYASVYEARSSEKLARQLQHNHRTSSWHLSTALPLTASVTPAEGPRLLQQAAQPPLLHIAGGGMYFYWKAGVLKYLQQHHDFTSLRLMGASAGALVATLAACGVDLGRVVARANELMVEQCAWNRLFGVAGIWGPMARRCLEELLPEDAHTRCSGRVQVCVTALPSLRLIIIEHFTSKTDLIDAVMASVHIPWFLDGRFAACTRGMRAVDGEIGWLIATKVVPLLARIVSLVSGASSMSFGSFSECAHGGKQGREGSARFVLDYKMDERLGFWDRLLLGPVRLRSLGEIERLVQLGAEYGRQLHLQGELSARLGIEPTEDAEYVLPSNACHW